MKPFYFNINDTLGIMAIPDADAHMDGHPVLTYSYTLYKANPDRPYVPLTEGDDLLAPDKREHPDYLGTIFFEQPDKSFTYTSDGMNELSGDDVQEIIEKIMQYRKNPNLWRV